MTSDSHREHDERSSLVSTIRSYLLKGPEIKFLVDLVKNSIVFIGILSIAAGLNSTVEWVEHNHYPWYITDGLWFVEILLFIGDIVWFSCKIVITTYSETVGIFTRYGIRVRRTRFSGVQKP